jgi:hypothetical protein
MDDPVAAYSWIELDPVMDAYCISVAVGADAERAAAAFGCDPSSRRMATFAEQWDMAMPYPQGGGNDTVQIDMLGTAVVCVEANGWGGVDQARAERLSCGGRYISTYRNVNAVMEVVHAAAGAIVRAFDPLLYDAAGALPEEAGLPFGHPGSPAAAGLAMIERLTGVALTREWLLDLPHPAYLRTPD